jgi:hypothetical protein
VTDICKPRDPSFGSALAIAISYTTNHSILWAIIHGLLSWLYVHIFRPVSGVTCANSCQSTPVHDPIFCGLKFSRRKMFDLGGHKGRRQMRFVMSF